MQILGYVLKIGTTEFADELLWGEKESSQIIALYNYDLFLDAYLPPAEKADSDPNNLSLYTSLE